MKKAGLFVFGIILISIFASAVSAQGEAPGLTDAPLISDVQKVQQFTTEENKTQYLKTEWNKLLVKQPIIGPVINVMDKVLSFLNPFFKIVIGYEYSFSWAFIFGIMIWLILFFFINPIMSQILNNGLFGGLSAAIIASLVGLSGVIKEAADLLSFVITNVWIAWLSLLIAIILALLAEKLGKNVKAKIKKAKEAEEERKTSESRAIVQAEGRAAKKGLEAYEEK